MGHRGAGRERHREFAGQEKQSTAGADGHWSVTLAPLVASAEARVMTVTGSKTAAPVNLGDILVGEVWLCSGQSNMDFSVAKTEKFYFAGVNNEAAEVAAANYPQIREFRGEPIRAVQPAARVPGTWKICTPENVREFSAIGYFFARDLQRALHIPIGIVTLTYGASTAQAWIQRAAIAADPRLAPALTEFDAKVRAYIPPTPEEQATWKKAADAAKAAGQRAPRAPKPNPVQDQHNPTVLYNGMIAPFVPFAVRGVLWYQGESITGDHALFPLWNETLIKDWRHLWGRELPFYFCQLAALDNNSNSPAVRAMQAEALRLPGTAMAVTIDIGDEKNVHPKDKQDVGDRLCRIALAKTYGKKIEYSGPEYIGVERAGAALRLKFAHAKGGLVARGGPLQRFEVEDAEGKFVPADAKIAGDTVIVSAAGVADPKAARYAWANYPIGCNLYNQDGLPAAPFETQELPAKK